MRAVIYLSYCFIFLISCGTTGNVKLYNFNVPQANVEEELRCVIAKDSVHSVPNKWSDVYKNHGPIEYWYVYFAGTPEEMYKIGFMNSKEWKSSKIVNLHWLAYLMGIIGSLEKN